MSASLTTHACRTHGPDVVESRSSAPGLAASAWPSSCWPRGERNFVDSREGATRSAAPGGTTSIPAPSATCSRTCTPIPSRASRTGRSATRAGTRSSGTSWTSTERYGVRPYVRFGQRVIGLQFDEAAGRWQRGDRVGARATRRGTSCSRRALARAARPEFPGSTGSTAASFTRRAGTSRTTSPASVSRRSAPAAARSSTARSIAPQVARLFVYQRTPAWVIPRDTRCYRPGARRRFARFDAWRRLHRARLYWSNESARLAVVPSCARARRAAARGLEHPPAVRDPELARRLTPDYTIGCKRILISNDGTRCSAGRTSNS